MRILKTILLFIFLQSSALKSQVHQDTLIKRLVYTCKVWGYLKYHHTNVTKGNVNWDSILIESIDEIKIAGTNIEFNKSLMSLILKAGSLNPFYQYNSNNRDTFRINSDFSWVKDPYFSDSIRIVLNYIQQSFINESISSLTQVVDYRTGRVHIPYFVLDNNYSFEEDDLPSVNKRILAVFRYWNIIHYFYQYPSSMSMDWDLALDKFLRPILELKTAEDYNLNFKKFTRVLNDSKGFYSNRVYDSIIGFSVPPIQSRFIENKTIVSSKLSSFTEVKIGDEIIEINGIPIEDHRDYFRALVEGSNSVAVERNVDNVLLRNSSDLKLKKADNSIYSINWSRGISYQDSPSLSTKTSAWRDTMLSDQCRFGIVDMTRMTKGDVLPMLRNLWEDANVSAIILDLRNETSLQFIDFSQYVYNFDYSRYFYIRKPNMERPGSFYDLSIDFDYRTYTDYPGRYILLVDEYTRGNAENFAISFQERSDVIRIGSTTDGAAGTYNGIIYLPGKIRTEFNLYPAYSKQGTPYYKSGVPLDYVVKPTIAGIRAGRDEVMEFALNCKFKSRNEITNSFSKIEVFPNPVKDRLQIHYQKTRNDAIEYELYDLYGRKIISEKSKNLEHSIDMSNLTTGVYILNIRMSKETRTFKVMKE